MLTRLCRVHLVASSIACVAVLLSPGCGSSTSTSTAPSPITRCGITLNTLEATVPATGGSGAVSVSATRDCVWSASVEGNWLTIKSGGSGQGEGTVEFSATLNPDPQTRTGAVVVNGSRAQITQSAGECVVTLASSGADVPPAGGTARVEVRASSQMCAWTATPDVPWIEIASGGSGRGNAMVTLSVAATTGPPRAGTVTVAGQRFSVTQAQGCVYAVDRTAHAVGASGGPTSVAISTAPACPWTAASNSEWIAVNPATGSGPAPVSIVVTATDGPERTGSAVIAGQLFTVTQSPGCTYQVQPTSHTIAASGGSASVSVSTAGGCSWTSASNVPWITFQGATSGSGPATVTFAAAATTGPARSGTLIVAGHQITVSQTQGCSYSISPQSQSVDAGGGNGKVTVTAGDGCAWSASSPVSWATISAGSSGSGNGEVQFSVAATSGPSRSTTLTIAGHAFTINQGQGCTFRLAPSGLTVDDNGGQRSFEVQAGDGCGWTAATPTPWITITSGTSGTGNGTVRFTVARNTGPSRSGSITAGGQTFTVSQGNGCAFTLSPDRQSMPATGGTGTVDVSTGGGCSWNAASNAPWLTVTSNASGSGNAAVGFSAAANTGAARTGTLTIANQTFTVEQAAGCTFSINPSSQQVPGAGGTTSVNVTTQGSCSWTASSNVPWIAIASGASGTGNAPVQLNVEPNPGAERTGTATIAGLTFTVTQGGSCSYAIAPTSQTVAAGGGPVNVNVTAPGTCGWAATSNVPWMSVTSGATGSGNGVVQLNVSANASAPRTGTATIAGQTFTVAQESGCSYAVAPDVLGSPAAGGSSRVDVTAQAGCTWTAASNVAWMTVTAGASGNGNGPVDLAIAANIGPARSGTLTIAGRTVTVNQESGCTVALNPTSQSVPATGGTGVVNVTSGPGCPWTATSTVPWIVVTSGASGSGDGVVQFAVQANATGAPRAGSITIGNQTFTVNQQ